jgi:hypothetical protein
MLREPHSGDCPCDREKQRQAVDHQDLTIKRIQIMRVPKQQGAERPFVIDADVQKLEFYL